MSDPVREFAENLIDDLRIAEVIRERAATDTGERLSLDEVIRDLGYDPDEFRG